MRTITLENGKTVEISEESYKALEGAVREVTYNDIIDKLYCPTGIVCQDAVLDYFSRRQYNKTIAINKLMNTAKYLNGDWKPDWNNEEQDKWSIAIEKRGIIVRTWTYRENSSFVYFKSDSLVERAISILGEEVVRAALNTDW